jgi:hypothetical protein
MVVAPSGRAYATSWLAAAAAAAPPSAGFAVFPSFSPATGTAAAATPASDGALSPPELWPPPATTTAVRRIALRAAGGAAATISPAAVEVAARWLDQAALVAASCGVIADAVLAVLGDAGEASTELLCGGAEAGGGAEDPASAVGVGGSLQPQSPPPFVAVAVTPLPPKLPATAGQQKRGAASRAGGGGLSGSSSPAPAPAAVAAAFPPPAAPLHTPPLLRRFPLPPRAAAAALSTAWACEALCVTTLLPLQRAALPHLVILGGSDAAASPAPAALHVDATAPWLALRLLHASSQQRLPERAGVAAAAAARCRSPGTCSVRRGCSSTAFARA